MAADSITLAFKAINAKDSAENWILVEVANKALQADPQKGEGLSNLIAALQANKLMFAAIRVSGVDEQASVTSKRPKVVQINWVGGQVPPMQRLAALSLKAEVSSLFQGSALSIDAVDAGDLTQEAIAKKLAAAGGAHKPSYYDFGNGEHLQLDARNE